VVVVTLSSVATLTWSGMHAGDTAAWQAATRALAAEAVDAGGGEGGRLVIAGRAHGLPGGGIVHFEEGLRFRLRHLTGMSAHLCDPQYAPLSLAARIDALRPAGAPDAEPLLAPYAGLRAADLPPCAEHGDAARALEPWPGPGHVAPLAPGVVGVRIPERLPEKLAR
jgi:hypothetical protein